jgi:diguanylate cyclase (GGDEF)-like protein
MLQMPQASSGAVGVGLNRHHIDAPRAGPRLAFVVELLQICLCQCDQAALLGGRDRLFCQPALIRTPRSHFHEHQRWPVGDHKIEFAGCAAPVAGDDTISPSRQIRSRQRLAALSCGAPCVCCHLSTIPCLFFIIHIAAPLDDSSRGSPPNGRATKGLCMRPPRQQAPRGHAAAELLVVEHLSRAITAMQPLEEFGPALIADLSALPGVNHLVLATYQESRQQLHFPYVVIDRTRQTWQPVAGADHMFGEVIRDREPQARDLSAFGGQSWLVLPLVYAEMDVGALAVGPLEAAQQHGATLRICAYLLSTALYLREHFGSLERTFAEQATTLADISEIARQLNATLDTRHVADVVLVHALGPSPDRIGAVLLLAADGTLYPAAQWGVDPHVLARWHPNGGSVAQHVSDVLQPEYQIAESKRLPEGLRLRSNGVQGVFPLRHEGALLGVLLVGMEQERAFSPMAVRFLQQLAAHAALAISNANAYTAINEQHTLLNRRMDQLRAVSRISQAISAHLNLQALLPEIVTVVQTTIGYRCAMLSLVDVDAPESVRRVSAVGIPDDQWRRLRDQVVPLSYYEALMTDQFRISRSFYIPHDHLDDTPVDRADILERSFRIELDERVAHEWHADDILLVPLYSHRNNLIGILSVDDPADRQRPTPENITVLEIFATQAATAIENARMYAAVEQQALTDNLTGLANQRHVSLHLEQHISWAERHEQTLAVLLLDIDHFKAYNDQWGHLAGNVVLREFAEILRQSVRTGDVVARWGGEEFLALLPQSTENGALEVAERIRQGVERHLFPRRPITVSIGVAVFRHGMSDQDVLAAADAALYRAKASRNAVSL